MEKEHDYDTAWKTILEAFEVEIVELLFPELFGEIDWKLGIESLDQELREIQKEIFDKKSSEKIISDKIIKVILKDKGSKILFIHVEVQSYSSGYEVFSERMFRYFYRIWDKFRYKYDDRSEIVAAAIYTYKGERGKDKRYVYKLPELAEDILVYNFRTIDVEKIRLENISDENPLKLVFKMAKKLLNIGATDIEIYNAKIELARELKNYNKVKNNEQIKALVDFLEYLFLLEDPELESEYEKFKKSQGGAFKLTIDEIRKIHYTQEGIEEGALRIAEKMLKRGAEIEEIVELTELSEEKVLELKRKISNK
ncbi:Rpn family recombination-promoting nuclease/putative transposase [Clostridium tagluense]|uniref:Rpn family recombination-promoting nuclease/putative transposase n=1 Tax=Clostridium tagluense TaxID=360422 RepID=UPI001CF45C8D|nr:Rpn family recombination-promoting nuclease/putative transposase [Clostridium tagluense]MCB2312100.1 Rpn family recombination-promoting nuclease/putative transposase [Clostridium tagluense]MCB2316715.1 Rpn family recombination-promoting nuclease/putative transposase [Clostridium tagluense]MCB2321545.1 Rpn family recombination-promoting nuclease/putative transposase [Clostridium tagluense]MCB2326584.1 Rpn family recombination-promoting nuclease/putative transposase [Clostridium tagluense]MCB